MSIPAYSEYKDANIHWIDRVPSHWGLKKVAWHLPYETGWTPPTDRSELYDGDQPWVTIADMDVAEITDTKSKITQQAVDERGGRIVPAGSFLFSFKLTVGQTAFLGIPAYINEAIAAFEPNRDVDLKFWSYAASQVIPRYARENIYGAAILNQDLIGSARFYVPSTSEQRQIADFLDHETARIDALIEEQQRLIGLLHEKRRKVVSGAVIRGIRPDGELKDSGIDFLGEIPSHWKPVRLKHAVARKKGAIRPGPFGTQIKGDDFVPKSEFRVYTQGTVINNDFQRVSYVNENKFTELAGFKAKPRDVLVTSRGTIARAAAVPDDSPKGLIHPCLIRVTVDERLLHPEYLVTLFNETPLAREQLGLLSNATTIDVVYAGSLEEVWIPLPPAEEQKEVLRVLTVETQQIDRTLAEANTLIERLRERRSALISAAVTGKIDVRERDQSTGSTEQVVERVAEEEGRYG